MFVFQSSIPILLRLLIKFGFLYQATPLCLPSSHSYCAPTSCNDPKIFGSKAPSVRCFDPPPDLNLTMGMVVHLSFTSISNLTKHSFCTITFALRLVNKSVFRSRWALFFIFCNFLLRYNPIFHFCFVLNQWLKRFCSESFWTKYFH